MFSHIWCLMTFEITKSYNETAETFFKVGTQIKMFKSITKLKHVIKSKVNVNIYTGI